MPIMALMPTIILQQVASGIVGPSLAIPTGTNGRKPEKKKKKKTKVGKRGISDRGVGAFRLNGLVYLGLAGFG